jgi:hypothetical protein
MTETGRTADEHSGLAGEATSLSDLDLAMLAEAANDPRADDLMNAAQVNSAKRLAAAGYVAFDSGVVTDKGFACLKTAGV